MLRRNADATLRKSGCIWSSAGMGISPHTHSHTVHLHAQKQPGHAVKLMNANATTGSATDYTHTSTACLS